VYKLVRYDGKPRLKVTSDVSKSTVPDCKRLYRVINGHGNFLMDVMCREGEKVRPGDIVFDPVNPVRSKPVPEGELVDIRNVVMEGGTPVRPSPSLEQMADRCADQLRRLPEGTLRLENPHKYKVAVSRGLYELRTELIDKVQRSYVPASTA
jgi:nicotinate phosphoribosyltransferase